MTFRSIALATTASLLATAVSITAHAAENTAASDVAPAETPPGAVLAAPTSSRPAPEIDPMRVTGEVLAGTALGAGLAAGSGYLLYQTIGSDCSESGDLGEAFDCGLRTDVLPVLLGAVVYPAGVAIGVAAVGGIGDVQGSNGLALTGAYLGSAAGFLLGGYLAPDRWAGTGIIVGFLTGAPIGAAIGYNWDLEYDQPHTGLVNVSGGGTRVSIPAVSVSPDPLRPQGTLTSVRLVDGRF